MKKCVDLWYYLAEFFLELEMFQTKFVEEIKTHILYSTTLSDIMCKNMVQLGRPQMTIWRMRIASWLTKATKTHPEYAIPIASPRQKRLHERASMLRIVHCLSCYINLDGKCIERQTPKQLAVKYSLLPKDLLTQDRCKWICGSLVLRNYWRRSLIRRVTPL